MPIIRLVAHLFNGRWGVQTDENGLYFHRARYYNPQLRRFINQDTVLGSITAPASLNRFAYANGNPVSGIDPFGLMYVNLNPNTAGPNSAATFFNIASNALSVVGGGIQMVAGALLADTGVGAPVGIYLIINGAASAGSGAINLTSMAMGGASSLNTSGIAGYAGSMYQTYTGVSNPTIDATASAVDLGLSAAMTGIPFTKSPNFYSSAVNAAGSEAAAAIAIGDSNTAYQQYTSLQTVAKFQFSTSAAANGVAVLGGAASIYGIGQSMTSNNSSQPPMVQFVLPK
jgi:RHS repeat-associated protein